MKLKKTFKGDQEMDRREFMLTSGLTGLALLAGCATSETNIKESGEFDVDKFLSWYKRNRLYNGRNPNLKRPHSANTIFKEAIDRYYTPGVDYSVDT